MVNVKKLSTPDLRKRIDELQQIQRTNPSHSPEWQSSSKQLKSCFEEMARREPYTDRK